MKFELDKYYRNIHGAVMRIIKENDAGLIGLMPTESDNLEVLMTNKSVHTDWTEIPRSEFEMILMGLQGPDESDGPWSPGWENRCNTLIAHKERIEYLEQLICAYEVVVSEYKEQIKDLTPSDNTHEY